MKVRKVIRYAKQYAAGFNKPLLLATAVAVCSMGMVGASKPGQSALARMLSFITPTRAVSAEGAQPTVTAADESSASSPAEPMQSARRITGWELITIRPKGFEPSAITRADGSFLLKVDNRSGVKDVALQLDRVGGSRLRAVQVPRQKLDWRDQVDLTPGTYLLTEANNPAWVCRITITAQ